MKSVSDSIIPCLFHPQPFFMEWPSPSSKKNNNNPSLDLFRSYLKRFGFPKQQTIHVFPSYAAAFFASDRTDLVPYKAAHFCPLTHWVIKGDMTDNSAEILFQSVWGVSRDPLPVCKGCQQRCSSSLYGVSAEILFQSVWGVSRDALPVCMGCQQRCSSNLYGVSAEILFQSVWGVSRDALPVCIRCQQRSSSSLYGVSAEILFQSVWGVQIEIAPLTPSSLGIDRRTGSHLTLNSH